MKYFAALDGLRAVSVLLVLALHASYGNFRGGFLGVDIFFALSGYLITANLITDVQGNGRVGIRSFYIRRFRRLAPALLAALVLTRILWTLTSSQTSFGSAAVPVLFYYANWKEAIEGPIALGALAHTWSLSIEEQFYFFWPVVISLLRSPRNARSFKGVTITAVLVGALVVSRFMLHETGSVLARYESTLARVDELLVGAFCALLQQACGGQIKAFHTRIATYLAWLALIVLLGLTAISRASAPWLYRGGFTLMAALAMVIILHLIHNPSSLLTRALSARPLVEIGRRSYGIYVYHLPLFLALEPLRVAHSYSNFALVALGRIAVTFVIAWISFRWLELPLRGGRSPIVGAQSVYRTDEALAGPSSAARLKLESTQLNLNRPLP
jgi:peptidoglycan/LPS O-acetylase OafA/YrhL